MACALLLYSEETKQQEFNVTKHATDWSALNLLLAQIHDTLSSLERECYVLQVLYNEMSVSIDALSAHTTRIDGSHPVPISDIAAIKISKEVLIEFHDHWNNNLWGDTAHFSTMIHQSS